MAPENVVPKVVPSAAAMAGIDTATRIATVHNPTRRLCFTFYSPILADEDEKLLNFPDERNRLPLRRHALTDSLDSHCRNEQTSLDDRRMRHSEKSLTA